MSDFHEMLLHHIAAVCLLFASSYGQYMGMGAVVAYLHDITDIFGCLAKLFNCTIY
jgi:preprotein translocase subunit SecF